MDAAIENVNLVDNFKLEQTVDFICILPTYQHDKTLGNVEIKSEEIAQVFNAMNAMDNAVSIKTHGFRRCKEVKDKVCDYCGKYFCRKSGLEDHLIYHVDPDAFKCQICQQRFMAGPRLAQHKTRMHHDRILQCDLCSKNYKTKQKLISHINNHTTSLRQCSHCLKIFASKYGMISHVRMVHDRKLLTS